MEKSLWPLILVISCIKYAVELHLLVYLWFLLKMGKVRTVMFISLAPAGSSRCFNTCYPGDISESGTPSRPVTMLRLMMSYYSRPKSEGNIPRDYRAPMQKLTTGGEGAEEKANEIFQDIYPRKINKLFSINHEKETNTKLKNIP